MARASGGLAAATPFFSGTPLPCGRAGRASPGSVLRGCDLDLRHPFESAGARRGAQPDSACRRDTAGTSSSDGTTGSDLAPVGAARVGARQALHIGKLVGSPLQSGGAADKRHSGREGGTPCPCARVLLQCAAPFTRATDSPLSSCLCLRLPCTCAASASLRYAAAVVVHGSSLWKPWVSGGPSVSGTLLGGDACSALVSFGWREGPEEGMDNRGAICGR